MSHGTETNPIVFISYSHDSEEHKKWVRDLASALRNVGIDVILDQWEIGPGDDVPKFMEQSVQRALRVIMVCTDQYVRKADDGQGGAGYEAMVVTGELVRNLGTRKFIPIIRQTGEKPITPICVSTRLFVDFSNDEEFTVKLEELARNIQDAPCFEKPPLGESPFTAIESTASTITRTPLAEIQSEGPAQIYELSLAYANDGNFAKWQELVHHEKRKAAESLLQWQVANAKDYPSDKTELSSFFLPAIYTHSGLFAAAFGAFDSTNERFHNQLSLMDSIRNPKGWQKSGPVEWVALPDLALFTYQALLGALAMSRQRPEAAYSLVTTRLSENFSGGETQPLFKHSHFTGWPYSLDNTCTHAWAYLRKAAKDWEWLWRIFGSEEDAVAAIAAYYLLLNTIDFISASKAKAQDASEFTEIHCPLFFVRLGDDVAGRAQSIFYSSEGFIVEILAKNQITDADLASLWNLWMTACRKWLTEVHRDVWSWHRLKLPHHDLPGRLSQGSNKWLIE